MGILIQLLSSVMLFDVSSAKTTLTFQQLDFSFFYTSLGFEVSQTRHLVLYYFKSVQRYVYRAFLYNWEEWCDVSLKKRLTSYYWLLTHIAPVHRVIHILAFVEISESDYTPELRSSTV